MPLRVALADDEPLPRERLERLLKEAGCEVMAIFENGAAVLEWFRAGGRADALFLDVQMPGATGLELLAELEEAMPAVLVTAHSQYSLSAFEHAAFDYLLKPVTADRLARTLQRLERHVPGPVPKAVSAISKPPNTTPARFTARVGEGMVFLELRKVSHFELSDEWVWAWVQGERFRTTWTSLAEVETTFPTEPMSRIQRHILLRPAAVLGLRPIWGRRVSARVTGGLELDVSRSATLSLKEILGA